MSNDGDPHSILRLLGVEPYSNKEQRKLAGPDADADLRLSKMHFFEGFPGVACLLYRSGMSSGC